ncbi:cobalt-precorrin-2 C(20)-methyltransferase [mine drainage metagenome]|uniref:Cobalt-precorrin-2 C(20)-methyltransferase n=1 Tax=mine drainage metagenome TaxID=410659 RepID=A0A1J5SDV1_9ZZZZ
MDRLGAEKTTMKTSRIGKLIGVSLGPGDPGLITRRAWEVMQSDVHWAYPVRSRSSDSYALDIVQRAGLNMPKNYSPLLFPMTHDPEKLSIYWLEAAQTVLSVLQAGRDVAFLVEGDASTYSTFGHLARTLSALDAAIEVEVIPGVTSFNAAAASVGKPLADVDDTVVIVPAGYGIAMLERLLDDADTLILLKVKPLLNDIIDFLARRNLLAHSCFIEKTGAPEERIVHDVASLKGEKVNYLSLLIIKNPDRQRGEIARGCRKVVRVEEQ